MPQKPGATRESVSTSTSRRGWRSAAAQGEAEDDRGSHREQGAGSDR